MGPPVDLSSTRENDPHALVVTPARLENRELRTCIDVKIWIGISHRVQMTGLAGQIEENVRTFNQVIHAVRIANVSNVKADGVLKVSDVCKVSAVLRDQAVNQGDIRASPDESSGEL
jgi:hypothetical protein